MNTVYVYGQNEAQGYWIGSVIGESSPPILLAEFQRGWVHVDGTVCEVHLRNHFLRCLESAGRDQKWAGEGERFREDLVRSLAGIHMLEIETLSELRAPFWIADRPDFVELTQSVRVCILIRRLAESPDVQVYLREIEVVTAGIERDNPIMRAGKSWAGGALPEPGESARRLARDMRVAEGALLACETEAANVVLSLDRSLGDGVFEATARICGARALAAGNRLYRQLRDMTGGVWRADLGEVLAVG